MRYTNRRKSENIRDSRGRGGRRAASGVGGMSLIALILYLLFGGGGAEPSSYAAPSSSGASYSDDFTADASTFDEEPEQFINALIIDLEDYWDTTFRQYDLPYDDAIFTYYDAAGVQSGCGYATPEIGPHYCPVDQTIYLDLGFFDQLAGQFGAPGDTAEAYVIGHEYAHHVQQELGISEEVRRVQSQDPRNANVYSVALELQADCLAGVWLGSLSERSSESGLALERGDIEEALGAAAAVGDDRIQAAATGRVNPESWTHGSSEQRQNWFFAGFDSRDTESCDTFEGL